MSTERARNMITVAAGRALLCAPLLFLTGLAGARPQSGKSKATTQTPPAPTRDSRGSGLRVELPTPVAETPVPFEGGGRARPSQTLSFTTPT